MTSALFNTGIKALDNSFNGVPAMTTLPSFAVSPLFARALDELDTSSTKTLGAVLLLSEEPPVLTLPTDALFNDHRNTVYINHTAASWLPILLRNRRASDHPFHLV